jgi:hypothetical protein
MARPLRIELAGGLYHVTSRGDRREDIFLCETDRYVWLEILGEVELIGVRTKRGQVLQSNN